MFVFSILTRGYIFFYWLLETGREKERNMNQLPPVGAPSRDQTLSLAMCPDQKLKPRTFGEQQDNAQTNWATQARDEHWN